MACEGQHTADEVARRVGVHPRPGSSSHGTSPSGRVAQVHDQRGESVGETARGRGVAGGVELVDEDLQALLAVARLMA